MDILYLLPIVILKIIKCNGDIFEEVYTFGNFLFSNGNNYKTRFFFSSVFFHQNHCYFTVNNACKV